MYSFSLMEEEGEGLPVRQTGAAGCNGEERF